METFFASGGQVAIFDGTNVTKKQRQYIKEYLSPKVQVIFLFYYYYYYFPFPIFF